MILSLACDTILILSQEALFCYPHHFRLLYSPQHSWGIRLFIQGETLFEGVMPPAGEKVTSDVHPYFAYETAPNTLERFTLGTVTGEGILKIEVLDGCARFGQIVIRKSEK